MLEQNQVISTEGWNLDVIAFFNWREEMAQRYLISAQDNIFDN